MGILPNINVNQKLEKTWRINYQWQSRWVMAEGLFAEPFQRDWQYSLSDFSATVDKKIQGNKALAVGMLVRLAQGQQRFRLLQQYAIVDRYPGFRLAHRLRTDQTWGGAEAATFRLRYRISVDFPLNGSVANPNEFYFKLNNEYLGALEDSELSAELRLVPLLGFLLTDDNKLESGLDYRFSELGTSHSRHTFWWALSWYYSF